MLSKLRDELLSELKKAADPERALQAQKYMKSSMPHLGVRVPETRVIARDVFEAHPLESFGRWEQTVRYLYRTARFREERYAALALTGLPRYREYQRIEALPLYEELILEGAWWDLVDEVAGHRLPKLLIADPTPMKAAMRRWSRTQQLWKRRAAILCQLELGAKTDVALLEDTIRPALAEKEFFLRKAIGWALRQYARSAPEWVLRYVRKNEAALSPLSKREALRALVKAGKVKAAS